MSSHYFPRHQGLHLLPLALKSVTTHLNHNLSSELNSACILPFLLKNVWAETILTGLQDTRPGNPPTHSPLRCQKSYSSADSWTCSLMLQLCSKDETVQANEDRQPQKLICIHCMWEAPWSPNHSWSPMSDLLGRSPWALQGSSKNKHKQKLILSMAPLPSSPHSLLSNCSDNLLLAYWPLNNKFKHWFIYETSSLFSAEKLTPPSFLPNHRPNIIFLQL